MMNMKKTVSLMIMVMTFIVAHAQMVNPVKFATQVKMDGTANAEIIFTGRIDAGWHVYSTDLGNNGPISATFHVNSMSGVKPGEVDATWTGNLQDGSAFRYETPLF